LEGQAYVHAGLWPSKIAAVAAGGGLENKELSQGFGLTGWEGAQHAYSPEISE